jgi:hypothetical protein
VVRATRALDTNYNAVNSANTSISTAKSQQYGILVTSPTFFTTGNMLNLTASGGQSTAGYTWNVSSGQCVLSGTTLTAARGGISCGIDVTRAGDNNYLADTESVVITVNKIVQTLTFTTSAPNPANPGMTYTVNVDSDQFLAPVIGVANNSSNVCAISAGVVSFNATGSCVIIASQSGNDTVAPGNVSQVITVTVPTPIPTTTVAPSTSSSGATTNSTIAVAQKDVSKASVSTTTTVVSPTSTLPSKGSALAAPIPTDPSQPQVGADGQPVEVKAGNAVAMVRGKAVKATMNHVNGTVVISLPNGLTATIGSNSNKSSSAKVSSDGVLRTYANDSVDVQAKGLVPGTTYTVYMFSQPVELGRGVTDANGVVTTSVKIPKGIKRASHTLQMNGVGKGGEVVSVSMGFQLIKRQNTTGLAVLVIASAMLLAMLGGRPVYRRRRV